MTVEEYGQVLLDAGTDWDAYDVGDDVATYTLAGVVVGRVSLASLRP